MNLPIALTLVRIVLVPLVIVFLISSDRVNVLIAAVIFVAASLTDWLDGLHRAPDQPGHASSARCWTRWPTSSWSPPRWCRSCTWTWCPHGSRW